MEQCRLGSCLVTCAQTPTHIHLSLSDFLGVQLQEERGELQLEDQCSEGEGEEDEGGGRRREGGELLTSSTGSGSTQVREENI